MSSVVPIADQAAWLLSCGKGKSGVVSGKGILCHGRHVCGVSRVDSSSSSSGVPVSVVVVVGVVGSGKGQSYGRQSCQRAGSANGRHGFHVLRPDSDSSQCSQCSQCEGVRCRAGSTTNIAGPLDQAMLEGAYAWGNKRRRRQRPGRSAARPSWRERGACV